MTQIEWELFVQQMATYFSRQTPTQSARDLWYGKVEKIPGEALPWILDWIGRDRDSWPINLPKTVWAGWYAWQEANPKRVAPEATVHVECDAPGCTDGYLWLESDHRGRVYSAMAHCDRCAVARGLCHRDSMSLGNMDELGRRGFRLRVRETTNNF